MVGCTGFPCNETCSEMVAMEALPHGASLSSETLTCSKLLSDIASEIVLTARLELCITPLFLSNHSRFDNWCREQFQMQRNRLVDLKSKKSPGVHVEHSTEYKLYKLVTYGFISAAHINWNTVSALSPANSHGRTRAGAKLVVVVPRVLRENLRPASVKRAAMFLYNFGSSTSCI